MEQQTEDDGNGCIWLALGVSIVVLVILLVAEAASKGI